MAGRNAYIALGILAMVVWAGMASRNAQRERGGNLAPITSQAASPAANADVPTARTEPVERSMLGVVGARAVDAWTLRFTGGEAAQVRVDGETVSRLGCLAQDAAGNLLDLDADTTGRCRLRWTPERTGSYRILIRNADSLPRAYRMVAH
jgi:hypothetical protein